MEIRYQYRQVLFKVSWHREMICKLKENEINFIKEIAGERNIYFLKKFRNSGWVKNLKSVNFENGDAKAAFNSNERKYSDSFII